MHAQLANKLSLEQDFTKDCFTWDFAHRIEVACENAKKENSWIQELDNTLQSIMKRFAMVKHHTHLREIASKLKVAFWEFVLFSETRFMEYAHRTFFALYPILMTKIQRDVQSDVTDIDLVQDREYNEILLAQTTFILNLIFMREVSHLIANYSKSSQKFDVLPFYGMNIYEKLILKLQNAKNKNRKILK